ncbi:ASB16 protein, partial [Serilophus lunatus]|nr:ASB16 protein [Serilophus lunatus]
MAHETFAFSSSALRSLQLQRELLEREDRRRALAREWATRRFLSEPPRSPPSSIRRRQYCRDPAVHNALYAGDLPRVQSIFKDEATANLVLEMVSEELVWSPEQGMGLGESLPALLLTFPSAVPWGDGWRGAGRADPVWQEWDVEDGLGKVERSQVFCPQGFPYQQGRRGALWGVPGGPMGASPLQCVPPHPFPLPSPRCAELLLAHGAKINLGTRDRQVTALHVAARQGLVTHVELYLHHGADPSLRTHQGETPLNAAAAAAEHPKDAERYLRVAERLLAAGADPGAAGRKGHAPLHNACANGHPGLARLLLRHGADATVPNGAGDTPMDCALRAVQEYRDQRPEETIALLLDHGARPGHPKGLCCQHPPALEVMLNAYDRVPPAEVWVGDVPPEVWEEHREFYASAVHMAGRPRRLQHLARWAIRQHLGARCHSAVPKLALPPTLRRYLQLPIEGLI